MEEKIILASASPQRHRLLSLLFPRFEILPTETDETLRSRNPKKETARLSQLKAEAAGRQTGNHPQTLIIAADTLVSARGRLLGKPASREEASEMLDLLSGRPHRVVTGFTLRCGNKEITQTVSTKIYMTPLTAEWKERYLNTDEWKNAAGGYRIQNAGEWLFSKMSGSYSNVVGLPMAQLRLAIARYFPSFLSLPPEK